MVAKPRYVTMKAGETSVPDCSQIKDVVLTWYPFSLWCMSLVYFHTHILMKTPIGWQWWLLFRTASKAKSIMLKSFDSIKRSSPPMGRGFFSKKNYFLKNNEQIWEKSDACLGGLVNWLIRSRFWRKIPKNSHYLSDFCHLQRDAAFVVVVVLQLIFLLLLLLLLIRKNTNSKKANNQLLRKGKI